MIVSAFKSKIFLFYSRNYYYDLEEETSESDDEESEKDKASVSKLEKLFIDSDKVYILNWLRSVFITTL